LGRLFGLDPAPAFSSRVLELGCGDGGNSLAIAQTLPGARVLGLDASASAIARGRSLAGAAGLENVELRLADLADPRTIEEIGPVDYVIAHGVYSWIPPAVRGAVLECCRRCLAPHGIAYVSYNAYPGSYLRDMARDILEYHLRGVREPQERLEQAQRLMETIIAVESPSPYARVLREHLQRMLDSSQALLFHDDLAPVSTPFYFHEFIEHAQAHALAFLSEADLGDSQLRDVPGSVAELIAGLPEDVIVREQHLDFFTNRMFRQTLLVPAAAPVTRAIDVGHVERMALSSSAFRDGDSFRTPDGAAITTSDPLVVAAMDELTESWPAALMFDELLARAWRRAASDQSEHPPAQAGTHLSEVMLEAYVVHVVELAGCVLPVASHAPERPVASPLAQAQCAAESVVLTTLVPGNRALELDPDRRLLALLDGTRDREALAAELAIDRQALEAGLGRLADYGLLLAG
jgi:SAM-dependent methyltransferase